MSVVRDLDVTVDTPALRRALLSVVPHASSDPEWPRHHRVRLYVGPEFVTVAASDSRTGALALVEIEENDTGVCGCFDVTPGDAKELARLFKPSKEDLDSGACLLRLQATDKELTATDVGGFFPGKSLTLNACPVDEQFPNVALVLRAAQARSASGGVDVDSLRALLANGEYLQRFSVAGAQFGEMLVVQPISDRGGILFTCAEHFIGLMATGWQAPEFDNEVRGRALRWSGRFDDVTASHPLPPVKEEKADGTGSVTVINVADLDALLLGPDGKQKPPKSKKKSTVEPDDEPVDVELDDDRSDVPSVPMFNQVDEPGVDDSEVYADTWDESIDRAVRAVEVLAGQHADDPWATTSTKELKSLLNVGHAKALLTMQLLIRVGAVGEANGFAPRPVLALPPADRWIADLRTLPRGGAL